MAMNDDYDHPSVFIRVLVQRTSHPSDEFRRALEVALLLEHTKHQTATTHPVPWDFFILVATQRGPFGRQCFVCCGRG